MPPTKVIVFCELKQNASYGDGERNDDITLSLWTVASLYAAPVNKPAQEVIKSAPRTRTLLLSKGLEWPLMTWQAKQRQWKQARTIRRVFLKLFLIQYSVNISLMQEN